MANEKMGMSVPLCPQNAHLFARNAIFDGIHGVGAKRFPEDGKLADTDSSRQFDPLNSVIIAV